MRELVTNCAACSDNIYCEDGFYKGDEDLGICLECSNNVRTYTEALLQRFSGLTLEAIPARHADDGDVDAFFCQCMLCVDGE